MSAPGRDPHVLIVAHQPWCAAAATQVFDAVGQEILRRTVDSPRSAADVVTEGWPDVVVVICPTRADVHGDRVRELLALAPDASILTVSSEPDTGLAARLRTAGARGHVSFESSPETLKDAIVAIAKGNTFFPDVTEEEPESTGEATSLTGSLEHRLSKLTRRERQVMELLGHGYSNREIASALGLREGTIRIYVHRVIRQLGLRNRVDVALCANRLARQSQD